MANINSTGSVRDALNRCMPAASDAQLGDLLAQLISQVNANTAAHNALTAKLDADAGVTDTNYAATTGTAATVIKDLENRF